MINRVEEKVIRIPAARFGLSTYLLTIFLVAIVFYSAFFLVAPDGFLQKPCGDCGSVHENFLSGYGWVDSSGNFASTRPPVGVLIRIGLKSTAVFFGMPEKLLIQFFNIIVMSLSAVVLYLIARHVFNSENVIVAPLVWISSPFSLWFLNDAYIEVPFFFLFFLSSFFFLKSLKALGTSQVVWAAVTGCLIGSMILTRSISAGLLLIFGLGFLVLLRRDRRFNQFKAITMFLLGSIIFTGPWSIIVYQETGKVQLFGSDTLTKQSLRNGVSFATDWDGDRQSLIISSDTLEFAEDLHIEIMRNTEKSPPQIIKKILEFSLQTPLPAFKFYLMKVSRVWFGTYSHKGENFAIALQIFYFLLLLYCGWKSYKRKWGNREFIILVSGLVGYFWIIGVIFEPLVRYMVAPMGLMFVFASVLGFEIKGLTKPVKGVSR
jgi:hypothetical protein